MEKALVKTDFHFPGQKSVYHGKVRDVYNINDELLVMVATDRISAFDVILPKGIPFKGQMLNQIAAKFLDATTDICPNWKVATPDPMVTVGVLCQGFPVEMIVRGYLCGSAWRAYKSGVREICGVKLPEGMKENQKFPEPIITPTTKAEIGEHDADISKEEILARGLATPEEYALLEKYTMELFKRGTQIAAERGLILVDTKYEFGKHDGKIYLMDEIHTPDSSRYFYSEGYEERFAKGEPQKQLSKEFVREWLMDNGFQGKAGQQVPEMTDAIVTSISDRYIELYEHIVGEKFVKAEGEDLAARIEKRAGIARFVAGPGLWISARDIEEILKVKAAFSVAVASLLERAGLAAEELQTIALAGALGRHVDADMLEHLGFVPAGCGRKVRAVGNTSLEGACLLAEKPELREELAALCAGATVLAPAEEEDFYERYVRAMRFAPWEQAWK